MNLKVGDRVRINKHNRRYKTFSCSDADSNFVQDNINKCVKCPFFAANIDNSIFKIERIERGYDEYVGCNVFTIDIDDYLRCRPKESRHVTITIRADESFFIPFYKWKKL